MSDDSTIFVSIAAYKDAEIYPTIQDLFAKAKRPKNLHVAICWQYDIAQQEPLDFKEFRDQISIINMDHRKSRGITWIRHLLQKLYGNETYFLQIDSHFRFIPNWDEEVIAELERCPSPKPILSAYPSPYTRPDILGEHAPCKQGFGDISEGIPNMRTVALTEKDKSSFIRSPLISAGFLFMKGEAVHEVPMDPLVYVPGEEISLAVRYWTHGYDMFVPSKTLNYHLYADARPDKSMHWDDHPYWYESYQRRSLARLRHLFGIEPSNDPWVLDRIAHYSLGKVRSLAEYEAFAGVNFREGYYSENAKQGIFNT